MDLYGEIHEFITGRGIKCMTGSVGGHDILLTDKGPAIFPISISATSIDEASEQAGRLRTALLQQTTETGSYPLIITEDRWRAQHEMMRTRLLAHLQIFNQLYARNCEVRKIDKQTAAGFLAANHSYGDASCRYRYGLYLKRHTGHNSGSEAAVPGTLVAVATFSNARQWIKGDKTIRSYEWTRYASLPGVRLSGGMGKLLNAFIAEVNPDDIMTYADLEWSEGKVYETLGFKLEGYKGPICFNVDASWMRSPVKPGMTECTSLPETAEGSSLPAKTGNLYFQNLGSNKYRLKLTDYQ